MLIYTLGCRHLKLEWVGSHISHERRLNQTSQIMQEDSQAYADFIIAAAVKIMISCTKGELTRTKWSMRLKHFCWWKSKEIHWQPLMAMKVHGFPQKKSCILMSWISWKSMKIQGIHGHFQLSISTMWYGMTPAKTMCLISPDARCNPWYGIIAAQQLMINHQWPYYGTILPLW